MRLASRVCGSVLAAAMTIVLAGIPNAKAAYLLKLEEVGADVIGIGSGSIDLADLTLLGGFITYGYLRPSFGFAGTGIPGTGEQYAGISGPSAFGSGFAAFASSGSGDIVQVIGGSHTILVPEGYASQTPLSSSSIWSDRTFLSLGLDPGTYVYSWGSGAHADTFTVQIGGIVPEASTWAMLLIGFALLGFAGWRGTRKSAFV